MADNETPVTDPSSTYGVNDQGEAVLRVTENGIGDDSSIYCVNNEGKACMRVSENVTSDDPTSIYGVNDEGKASVRVIGAGGGTVINNEDINVTSNGVYEAGEGYTGLGTVNVNVPTTAPASYRAFEKDANGKLVNSTSTPWVSLPTGTTDLDAYIFYQAYKSTPANILSGELDLSSLTIISGNNAMGMCFYGCPGITSVNLSNLVTLSGNNCLNYTFQNCSGIRSVNVNSLTTISGNSALSNSFNSCSGISSIIFSSLTTITGNNAMSMCFSYCTSLTSLSFPALTSASFGSYTSQFNNMLQGVTGCTVHFPSNLQSVIGSWGSVTAGFNGTNTTVLFDLPATE